MSSQTSAAFLDDELSGASSLSSFPFSQPPNSPYQPNQNPYEIQTLDDAFDRLSVSPFSFNNLPPSLPFDHRDGFNAVTKTEPFDRRGHQHLQSSNLVGQIQETHGGSINNTRAAANAALVTPENNPPEGHDGDAGNSNGIWPGSSNRTIGASSRSYSSSMNDFFPSGYSSRGFPSMPFSNGAVDQFHQRNSGVGGGSSLPVAAGLNNINNNNNSVGGRSYLFHDLRGKVVMMAKDQNGSRILRQKLERLTPQEVSLAFLEMINHFAELMVDPCGSKVVLDILKLIREQQRTLIIMMITKVNLQLVEICLNPHGSCTVEKLLEHVTNQEQRALIVRGLRPGAVSLATDTHGHRVLMYCLKHFSHEESKYLLSELANHLFGIATDKTGCCVIQECVKYAHGQLKLQLIAEIILNAQQLSEDSYGNYVVQHLLGLQIPAVTESLMRQLEGSFFYLSCNKYGSNVVEKFFQCSEEQNAARITVELLCHPNVAMLLVDPYGNYVIQSALVMSKDPIRSSILLLIQQNYPMMRSNVYGQKILERFDRGKIRAHNKHHNYE
ncbi:hypothetical protein HN51_018809 [Arachis hypogaea]|uniref:PUM-HD domain-containing protein n=2 Tax=Arachis TaxID=3817 RepID=A0A445BV23_ARAHY|nr:pumilio homolog 15 [Arachis duranensis]XP_025613548.1 pumilio homolog 15 [Arachis hypogaea]QHO30445.1 uncharacterized protein DS421_8g233300 [Arachis hypogaea]RYR42448.1 hypothetical protein Ahy_A08g038934 [Arachis hypogaea]